MSFDRSGRVPLPQLRDITNTHVAIGPRLIFNDRRSLVEAGDSQNSLFRVGITVVTLEFCKLHKSAGQSSNNLNDKMANVHTYVHADRRNEISLSLSLSLSFDTHVNNGRSTRARVYLQWLVTRGNN